MYSLGFVSSTFIFSIYYIYRLIKSYKTKAGNAVLLKNWRSIFNNLIIIPGVCLIGIVQNFKSIPWEDGFKTGEYFGRNIFNFIIFWTISKYVTYFIPWFVAAVKSDKTTGSTRISANVLGAMILIIWLPINAFVVSGMVSGMYHSYAEYKGKQENFSSIIKEIKSYCIQYDFNELLLQKHGFNLSELNDDTVLNFVFEGKPISIEKSQQLEKLLLIKIDKLEKIHKWLKNKHDKVDFFDHLFDETLQEYFFKCDAWHKIPINDKKEFIVGFKIEFKRNFNKNKNLLKTYNVYSPLEFKLRIYQKALKLLILNVAIINAKTQQEVLDLEILANNTINTINNYIKQETEYLYKLKNEKI